MRPEWKCVHASSRCTPLLVASLSLALAGCLRPRPEEAAPPPIYVKLHFGPPAAIALHYAAVSGTRHTVSIDSVVEAAGRVDSLRGDTITIVALYITKAPALAGAETPRTPVRAPSNIARLTAVIGPNVRVEPWTSLSARSHGILWNVLMVVTVAPLLLLVFDLAHSPR